MKCNESLGNTGELSKVFPVCLHPKYGGWFALRGVLIFENARVNDSYLQKKNPPEILNSQNEISKLLHEYNHNWKNWNYRDIGMQPDIERYSDLQKTYFETEPSARNCLLEKIVSTRQV